LPEQIFTNCTVGGPISVHVKDGKITRIRPLVIDENDFQPWIIKTKDKAFSPHKKVTIAPFVFDEKNKVYGEDRIKYPLKRVDFNPKGERHPENRGKSGYVRISWDEAFDIITGEMKRIRSDYGPSAITAMTSSHHNWGNVGYKFGPFWRFFNILGYTSVFDNPDSWEGFHWGAIHTYGFYWSLGAPEQYGLLEDALQNTEVMIYWSNDPDTTRATYCAQESSIWRLWLREMGIKQVFIDPHCNYTAGILGNKWIAPRVGTDAAMAAAIAYLWIKEDTYDKKYVDTHTEGFEEFRDYILGEKDKIPKTPEWAEKITEVSAKIIRALAREWASKRTMLSCGNRGGFGGAMRQAYGHEWSRLMVLLQAMQGLGKPGVGLWGATMGAPSNYEVFFPGYADSDGRICWSRAAKKRVFNPVKQHLYRLLVPESILNPPVSWVGEGFCGQSIEQQFIPYTYPMPGHSEVKMFYRYGGSFMGTMTDTNKWAAMYQSPKLEFVVNQDCWMMGETKFADIILPACTSLERNDISEFGCTGCGDGYVKYGSNGCNYRVVVYQKKCIEPLYESKSDYEIFTLLADRMGFREDFTEGKSEEDWVRGMFEISDLPKYVSWEEFEKKGYFVIPFPKDYKTGTSLRWYYEGRPCDTPDNNPKKNTEKSTELATYSGKIEFVSRSLLKHFPDDKERPPMPRYIPSWEGPNSPIAKKYPLQFVSPHSRFSYHTHYDKHGSWIWEIPGHRVAKDGYYWQAVRIHPIDAESRGIRNNDVVKLYNDRGVVLGVAQITERIKPGIIHSYCSGGIYDPMEPGKPYSVDKGGCVNLLTSARMLSKNAPGMAPNSCQIEVAKWEV
jgi:molybdopterin guanine dinucleotide-containing S/N-oxide reductase-like protein